MIYRYLYTLKFIKNTHKLSFIINLSALLIARCMFNYLIFSLASLLHNKTTLDFTSMCNLTCKWLLETKKNKLKKKL